MPTSVGKGTADAPCTVWQVLDGTAPSTDLYVAGYVVGYVTNTINKATFGKGGNTTNIMLAPTPETTSISEVITVQLNTSKMSKGVSLAYNPDSLGRAVMLHAGVVADYCHTTGLRDNDSYLWLGNAAWLNLNHGQPTGNGGGNSDEEGNNGNDSGDGNEGDDSDIIGTIYHTGTEIWGLFDTEDLDDVTQINDHIKLGVDERSPLTIDYIFRHELNSVYKDGARWMVGYVRPVNDTSVEVWHGSSSMILDLDDSDMASWMHSTLPGKDDRLLRIQSRLKFKSYHWHIVKVQSLDWLIAD